jgi:hypothetical protein
VLETEMPAVSGVHSQAQHPSTEQWALLDKELMRAHRVASDSIQSEDIAWLCKGFSAFLSSGGKIPLERCLCLPTNERALRRARRDHWLRRAWLELEPTLSPWRRSEMLANEIQRFQTGKWGRWSHFEHAPAGSRPLDEALFEAFRCHERIPCTAMQLHNIAGHHRG